MTVPRSFATATVGEFRVLLFPLLQFTVFFDSRSSVPCDSGPITRISVPVTVSVSQFCTPVPKVIPQCLYPCSSAVCSPMYSNTVFSNSRSRCCHCDSPQTSVLAATTSSISLLQLRSTSVVSSHRSKLTRYLFPSMICGRSLCISVLAVLGYSVL